MDIAKFEYAGILYPSDLLSQFEKDSNEAIDNTIFAWFKTIDEPNAYIKLVQQAVTHRDCWELVVSRMFMELYSEKDDGDYIEIRWGLMNREYLNRVFDDYESDENIYANSERIYSRKPKGGWDQEIKDMVHDKLLQIGFEDVLDLSEARSVFRLLSKSADLEQQILAFVCYIIIFEGFKNMTIPNKIEALLQISDH